ncbi:DUF3047 domain-containing protein [Zwartia sp.]|uniref:DUF3047 domain-containing protein n=1 Tax=Zwartia sp. TaxID=2978004 RepID=UPI0027224DAD|nr:DUF3047 domain-containing protein [Zwartia sp.]MDO9023454.1 DUF3047 domain-containing protein [Zwartia sp.]
MNTDSLLVCIVASFAVIGASAVCGISHAQSDTNVVGQFSGELGDPPAPWRIIQFDQSIAPTLYQTREWGGVSAVQAQAAGSMALLARPVEVDLNVTPILCWRWRVEGIVNTADMNTKAGDDYAARVYVAFKLPADQIDFGLRLKLALARGIYGDHVPDAALNYVWDNKNPIGHKQFNAYTDRTQMIVQRSGAQHLGSWMNERVDILSDVTLAYGSPLAKINLLAVASDTDNTKESVQAGFADLHFVGRDQPCVFPLIK